MDKKDSILAPIIITIIVILYYILYFAILISVVEGLLLKLFLFFIPLAICICMIYVCIERIHEIEEGETDDISKY